MRLIRGGEREDGDGDGDGDGRKRVEEMDNEMRAKDRQKDRQTEFLKFISSQKTDHIHGTITKD